jgi:hypothetical protein
MGVKWETPGEGGFAFTPIFRAPKSGTGYFVLLGPPEGVVVHWAGKTVPCVDEECAHCKVGDVRKFLGHYPVIRLDRKPVQGILELTETPTNNLGPAGRGDLIRVHRNNGVIVARLVELCDRPPDFPSWIPQFLERPLPESIAVRAALLRIWRLPPEPTVVKEEECTVPFRKQA